MPLPSRPIQVHDNGALRMNSRSGRAVDVNPADPLAWAITVLSMLGLVITMAGSSLGAAVFLGAWVLMGFARAGQCARLVFRAPELWLIGGLTLASTAWSVAPDVTARAAAQLLLTVAIASLATGFLRPRDFVSAMAVSLLGGAVLSVLLGREGIDGMTGARVFLGIFASKNTMALFMSFLAIFAVAVLFDRGQHPVLRGLAAIAMIVGLPLLLMARSAGATMTTAASLAVLIAVGCYARLSPRGRLAAAAVAAAVLLPCMVLATLLALNGTLGEELSGFIASGLGKDPTLTGRTVLWQIALEQIGRRPFEGTGYYAFWLQGNPLAEAIWRSFSIESRMGFHFHNTILEFAVELGWPGVVTVLATLVLAIVRAVRLALADRTMASGALVATLFCLVARMAGEVDMPYPFAIGTFLMFAAAAFGADHARRTEAGVAAWRPARAA